MHREKPSPLRAAWMVLVGAAVLYLGPALIPSPALASTGDCRAVSGERPVHSDRSSTYGQGLLWKIEGPGIAPSFLFGTFHTGDPRVTRLPCPVREAFDTARSFSMEVIANGPGLVAMADAMFFRDGTRLPDVLGEQLYADTLAALGTAPAAAGGIDRMKPWAVMLTLSTPRAQDGLFLDMALQLEATRQGKPTYGLETMQEQIAVFDELPLADQVSLLRATVHNQEQADGLMEEITRAYLGRDLDALVAINNRYRPADARAYDTLMDRLLRQRNTKMVERLAARLEEGGAFVAIGALHLPGDTGVLRLLAHAGYRVTVIY